MVDHLTHRGGFAVGGHDKDTRSDLAGIAGLVEEGPDAWPQWQADGAERGEPAAAQMTAQCLAGRRLT